MDVYGNCLSCSRFSPCLRSSSSRHWASLFACSTCRSITCAHHSLWLACESEAWPLADSNRSDGAYSLRASEGGSLFLSFIEISVFSRQKFALSMAFSVSVRFSCNPSSSKNDSYSSLVRSSSLSAPSIFAACSRGFLWLPHDFVDFRQDNLFLALFFRNFQLSEQLGPTTTRISCSLTYCTQADSRSNSFDDISTDKLFISIENSSKQTFNVTYLQPHSATSCSGRFDEAKRRFIHNNNNNVIRSHVTQRRGVTCPSFGANTHTFHEQNLIRIWTDPNIDDNNVRLLIQTSNLLAVPNTFEWIYTLSSTNENFAVWIKTDPDHAKAEIPLLAARKKRLTL